jgi:penicillin amidase
MKYLKFFLSLILLISVFYGLNNKFGSIPPIGKFLNPYSGFWQNETDESIEGAIHINGLSDQVTVHYDAQLIPHVFAKNDSDLYRAQGYITAKHRLWQMEFQTHSAAGRISEIIGEVALDYDRKERRMGMEFGAEQALKAMREDPKTAELVEAYAMGVNDYINQLDDKDIPVEYKLLDYKPEQWSSKKTALLLMLMTKDLASSDNDLERTNALRIFGKEKFDFLFPDYLDDGEPVIPEDTDWSFIDAPIRDTPVSEMIIDSISKVIEKPDPDNGSNNWAVSGAKSYSGNPILANDPHLSLSLPSIWFVMQLSTPEHNAFGATLPGALGVISGFNNHISWGETNARRDLVDWYKIEFDKNDLSKYKYDGQWKKVSFRMEEIKIRGGLPFKDTVRYTHHGPVTYDTKFMGNGRYKGYAMKWIGHHGGNNQRTFLELNRAKNYDDYVNALSHYSAPAQNFVFASVEGDIALWIQGKFPNKWNGQGKFLLDGSNPEHDWQSFIPQRFNVHTKNPERGFVSSANQRPVNDDYPYYVMDDFYENYRNRVINDFFNAKEKFEIQDFKDLHNNNYNLKAAEMLPYMITSMKGADLNKEESKMLDELKAWNYLNNVDEVGPSIWTNWWWNLNNLLWDEFDIKDVAMARPGSYHTISLLKNNGMDSFMDIKTTPKIEKADDLFLISFKETVASLTKWKAENGDYNWKAYKATHVDHLLQGLPAFSRFNIPIGGGSGIVNATKENHGPSWRMIVEMSSPPKALGIYPGGQSGNPGSMHYDDFIDTWAAGNYHELNFMQSDEKTEFVIGTQTLNSN